MRGWFMLASHLGMSLQRTMAETTSTEFKNWMYYLVDEKMKSTKNIGRVDILAAHLITEIRRSYVKYPERVKLIDVFNMLCPNPENEKALEERKDIDKPKKTAKERIQSAKNYVFSVLGKQP